MDVLSSDVLALLRTKGQVKSSEIGAMSQLDIKSNDTTTQSEHSDMMIQSAREVMVPLFLCGICSCDCCMKHCIRPG